MSNDISTPEADFCEFVAHTRKKKGAEAHICWWCATKYLADRGHKIHYQNVKRMGGEMGIKNRRGPPRGHKCAEPDNFPRACCEEELTASASASASASARPVELNDKTTGKRTMHLGDPWLPWAATIHSYFSESERPEIWAETGILTRFFKCDYLITDCTIMQDWAILEEFLNNGVTVYSYPGAHAKTSSCGDLALLGSANITHAVKHKTYEEKTQIEFSPENAAWLRDCYRMQIQLPGTRLVDAKFLEEIRMRDQSKKKRKLPKTVRRPDVGTPTIPAVATAVRNKIDATIPLLMAAAAGTAVLISRLIPYAG